MIIKSSKFITSAVTQPQYPEDGLPEIAFAGRSNVGKSSLINTLINRKQLVKTSSTPGRTQLINFFMINKNFFFVDLPGYGYAKVPEHVKKNWGPMIETYLSTRETLRGVVLILDLRRIPAAGDLDFIKWLNHFRIPTLLVLTKADKIAKTKRIQNIIEISNKLGISQENLILFSAKTGLGKEIILDEIEALLSSA